jgi:hypothetical protein
MLRRSNVFAGFPVADTDARGSAITAAGFAAA